MQHIIIAILVLFSNYSIGQVYSSFNIDSCLHSKYSCHSEIQNPYNLDTNGTFSFQNEIKKHPFPISNYSKLEYLNAGTELHHRIVTKIFFNSDSIVYSPLDGHVILSEFNNDGGYTIAIHYGLYSTVYHIEIDSLYFTIYNHNCFLIKKGDKIFKINSNSKNGSKVLFFELYYKNKNLDPRQWFNN